MADSRPAVLQAAGHSHAALSALRPNVKLIGLLALGHLVLAQAYLPRHAGMASGLIVGFAIGTGGIAVTLLGLIADHHGVTAALWISALLPLAGFAAARFLPAPRALSPR